MGNLTSCHDMNEDWAPDEALDLTGLSGTELRMAELFNEKGGLITAEAASLGIAASAAAGTMLAESGGRGYKGDGRMVIRFENHWFWNLWGKEHPETYNQHFSYNTTRDDNGDGRADTWKDHLWREDPNGAFTSVHANQGEEWKVIEFAMGLGDGADEAAAGCTSFGAGQIMGFNYSMMGYSSALEMFEAMRDDPEANVGGVFNFIRANTAAHDALKRGDYHGFATQYNGSGKAAEYAGIIENYANAWDSVMAKKGNAGR